VKKHETPASNNLLKYGDLKYLFLAANVLILPVIARDYKVHRLVSSQSVDPGSGLIMVINDN
jgi:hypothetical protein